MVTVEVVGKSASRKCSHCPRASFLPNSVHAPNSSSVQLRHDQHGLHAMTGQDQRLTLKHRAASLLLAGACLLAAAPAAVSQQAKPQPASLEGSWSGGGTVVFPSGSREKARCRATFRRQTSSSFAMSA